MQRRQHWQHWRDEYGLPLLFFIVWSLIFSWPLPRYFTSHLIGSGGDARHNLWILWHVKEAVLGRHPFWDLPALYYPEGASLLTHGLGPVTGFLALPFWPWGPEAAHNGAVLLSLILTGYAMYLLARTLGLPRSVALFAGLFLLAAPIHLVGLHGHITKVFVAGPPLALLCFLRALDPRRSLSWAVATGTALLLTLAHSGYQFVFTSILLPFVALMVWQREGSQWRQLLWRIVAAGLASMMIVGPLLLAIRRASAVEGVRIDSRLDSLIFQPDAIEFFLPNPGVSRFFGSIILHLLKAYRIEPTIETAVYLSWVGLLLGGIVLLKGDRWARSWLLLSAGFVVLALGPRLQIIGNSTFTKYQMPIILPYALLTTLPGLEFMRVPGRFMIVGYIVWSVTVSMGLAWLLAQRPRWRRAILMVASTLILVEFWPIYWPVEALLPVPDFYREAAVDDEMYGVLDLPVKPTSDTWDIGYSSYYQIYQMTHRKGIASGYISRTFATHPVLPCIIPDQVRPEPGVLVNGRRADCRQNLLFDLAAANFRYVVWHQPQPDYPLYTPGSWGDREAAVLVEYLFGDQVPLIDDSLVRVYAVPPSNEAEKTATVFMAPGEGWHTWEGSFRWASSPASLSIWSPRPQRAVLEVIPYILYDPELILGTTGRLTVSMDGGLETTLTVYQREKASFSLNLSGGWQEVQLWLDTGNIIPFDSWESDDRRELSFSVRSLNLRLLEAGEIQVSDRSGNTVRSPAPIPTPTLQSLSHVPAVAE